jgi:signal transduction histidine kinase
MDKLSSGRRRTYIAFSLVVFAISCFILMSERAYSNAADTLNDINSMGQANIAVQRTTTELLLAEKQMNSYLQNGDVAVKTEFDLTVQRTQTILGLYSNFPNASAESVSVLLNLKAMTQSQLWQMSNVVEKRMQSGKSTDTQLFKINMEDLRQLRTDWVTSEASYIVEKRSIMVDSLNAIRVGVVALGIISLLGLFYYLRQSSELDIQRLAQKEAIRLERDRLTIEVASRTSELTELTQHLQSAIEEERLRLSRNLHDDLGALLTSAKLDAARIRSRLNGIAPEAVELLGHLVVTLDSGITLGRQIIEDLRPSALSNLGLVAALEILIREFANNSGVRVYRELSVTALDPAVELTVYRVVQETLANVLRHANANEVWVTLSSKFNSVTVTVRDDGVGFEAKAIRKSAYGLLGMRYRVEALGGKLTIVARSGQGTTVLAVIPLVSAILKN